MPVYEINGRRPIIGENTWIAPTAELIGDVRIGDNCYIGFGAILRGDYGTIIVGNETAIEEGVMIHARPAGETVLGKCVTVGHMAMLHNTTIQDYAVIGMHSTISDFSEIGQWAIIGEHSLVKRHQIVPEEKIYAGVPSEEKGDVMEKNKEEWTLGKKVYFNMVQQYRDGLVDLTELYYVKMGRLKGKS